MEPRPEVPRINVSSHVYVVPRRAILEPQDLGKWLVSSGSTQLLDFVMSLNESVVQATRSSAPHLALTAVSSPVVLAILQVLADMDTWLREIPPLSQAQRFGNKAFKTWYERLQKTAPIFMAEILSKMQTPLPNSEAAAAELAPYLVESVGNSTRIDYGTGHEQSFAAWLCGLYMVGALTKDDFPALVLHVFSKYLQIMRSLQRTYMMEPAGSHGVWGLDDFQFLPFLWGSAQLIGKLPGYILLTPFLFQWQCLLT